MTSAKPGWLRAACICVVHASSQRGLASVAASAAVNAPLGSPVRVRTTISAIASTLRGPERVAATRALASLSASPGSGVDADGAVAAQTSRASSFAGGCTFLRTGCFERSHLEAAYAPDRLDSASSEIAPHASSKSRPSFWAISTSNDPSASGRSRVVVQSPASESAPAARGNAPFAASSSVAARTAFHSGPRPAPAASLAPSIERSSSFKSKVPSWCETLPSSSAPARDREASSVRWRAPRAT